MHTRTMATKIDVVDNIMDGFRLNLWRWFEKQNMMLRGIIKTKDSLLGLWVARL